MLNLFQHLINSMSYETLNQVQGDEKAIATQPLGDCVAIASKGEEAVRFQSFRMRVF